MNPYSFKSRISVWATLTTLLLASVVVIDRFDDSERGRLTYAESRSHIQSLLDVEWPTGFGTRDEGRWLLQGGFLHPEPDGAWLKEGTGSLLLNVKGSGGVTYLSLDIIPALNARGESPQLQVRSSVEIRSFQLAPSGSNVRLLIAALGLEEINITCEWPHLGRDYGVQSDLRNLCAKLHRASLDGI